MGLNRIILSFLLFCPMWLQAQFVTVDWNSACNDSLLPVCASVVDLPKDYMNYTYSAHVEYPEYQKMTAEEIAHYQLKTKYASLPSQPDI